jgi:hypothetical protein
MSKSNTHSLLQMDAGSRLSGGFGGIPVLNVLERMLTGGMRHREEMARIRMAEKDMEEQYRLQNRQLDAAFNYAMKQLEARSQQMDQHFKLQMQAMALEAAESGAMQQMLIQTMQLAAADHVGDEVRLAAIATLPCLMDSFGARQAARHQQLLASQRQLLVSQQELGRLPGNRDNPFLLQHYSGDEP